jgi:hypothetical protein
VGDIRNIALVLREICLAKGEFINRAGAPAANDFTVAAKIQLSGTDPFTDGSGCQLNNALNYGLTPFFLSESQIRVLPKED